MKKLVMMIFLAVFALIFSSCAIEEDPANDSENNVNDESVSGNDEGSQSENDENEKNNDAETNEKPDIDKTEIFIACTPGETQECYSGPSNSKGVGICKAGIQTCVVDGTDWSACEGQVLPSPEICGDGIDQDCKDDDMTTENAVDIDGDGYTYCDGDCCETSWDCTEDPGKVNPGAYEFEDNAIDDNCNGEIDEIVVCDENLSLQLDDYPGNAEKLAKGMGVCEGLIKAELSLAGDPVSENIADDQCDNYSYADRASLTMPYYDKNYKTFAVEPQFGNAMMPLEGKALSILSTADWDNPTVDAACATLVAGDMKTASTVPSDWINMMPNCEIPKAPSCGGSAPQDGLTNQCSGKEIPAVQDPIMLTLTMRAPSNARAFEFNLFFMSIEFPSTVCNDANYNDFFIALIDSTYNAENPGAEYMNPYDKNLAKDTFGNPVGVDLAPAGLFTACNPNCGGLTGIPNNLKQFCTGDQILEGTGFESVTFLGQCTASGGTGWLKTTGNVVPGEEFTLRLALWEQGDVTYGPDHSWDSTVVLDGFKWLPSPGKPGTEEK